MDRTNALHFETMPGLGCPSDHTCPGFKCIHGRGNGSYAPNFQMFATVVGPGFGPKYRINNIPDGISSTLFLAERYALPNGLHANAENEWISSPGVTSSHFAAFSQDVPQFNVPQSLSDWRRANTFHSAGMVSGVGDGSVRTLGKNISQPTWWNLCVPDDGQVTSWE